jgi:hypothetical protein
MNTTTTSNGHPDRQGRDLARRTSAPARRVPPPAGRPDDPAAVAKPDLAAAAIESRARRRARARLYRRLDQILRRRHIPSRAALNMLAAEADHIGPGRDPGLATHGESLLLGAGKESADSTLARSQRGLDKHAEEIERLQNRRAELRTRAGYRAGDLVRHPDGGLRPVCEVAKDEAKQRAQIEADRANGSRKHQRLPRWLGRIPQLVLLVDFCLLLYFFAGITDVDWASPLSADLVFAVLLAVMVTMLSYGFLAFAGHRLRSHKDHSGAIALADLDGLTKAIAAAALAAIVALSALMFARMRIEVLYALGPHAWATALLIALTLAVVSALANFLVIAIHALDGSDQAARLEALSRAASGPLAKAHKMQEEADIIPGRIALRRRRARRDVQHALAKAGRHLTGVHQIIDAARARHQAAGPHASPAFDPNRQHGVVGYRDPATAPAPDLRPLHTASEHINAELPAQASWNPRG